MYTQEPQLAISRVLEAARALVFEAFMHEALEQTSIDDVREIDVDLDAKVGMVNGHFRPALEPTRVLVELDLVARERVTTRPPPGREVLRILVTGELQDGVEPFDTRFRVEFHDAPGGKTRLELRQWLGAHLAGSSNDGWLESLEKLEAVLLRLQAGSAEATF